MLHRIQQLGIDPRQPRQGLRIQPIVFLAALPDQSHLAGIGHDHFVPQLAQQTASRANASRFPAPPGCAAGRQKLPATLSRSYGLAVPVGSGRLHPARSTSCCDLPGRARWSVSVEKYSCSASSPRCYPSSLPVSFISCALSTSITWERTPHPVRRPAFSLENTFIMRCGVEVSLSARGFPAV